MIRFTALALFLLACTEAPSDQTVPSKDDYRDGKGDHGFDVCEAYDWYGDGECDTFCPKPDPDCGAACGPAAAKEILVAIEGGGAATVDASNGAVRKRFDTGPDAFGALYSPDGTRAFVTDKTAGTLLEINRATGAVVQSLAVGKTPQQPAMTSGGRMYIPLAGEAAVAVVDVGSAPGAAMSVLRKLPIGDGTKPHIVALSPDQQTLWVTVQGKDPKVVSFAVTATGEGAPQEYRYDIVPRVIAASNTAGFFTAHHSTGLHRVDLASGTVTTPFMDRFGSASEARKQIEGVSASSDGRLIGLTHEGRKALVVVERVGTQLKKVLDIPTLSSVPYWVSLDPGAERVYVSIPGSGTVQAYGIGCTNAPLWTANVGGKVKRMSLATN